jgi:peroxiredoxin
MEPPEKGDGGSTRPIAEWIFYVIAGQAGGRWRIVFSENRSRRRPPAAGEQAAQTVANDGFFEITSDGLVEENWTITPLANPTTIFPRLPSDRGEMESGWHSSLRLDGAQRRFVPSNSDCVPAGTSWQFIEDCQTQLDGRDRTGQERRYTFDLRRGLVRSVTSCVRPDASSSRSALDYDDSIDLVEEARPGGVAGDSVVEEAERYFERCEEYQRLVDLALWDLPQAAEWLDGAAAVLERFEPTVSVEFVREFVRRKRALHERECGGMVADTEKVARMIGRAAPDFAARDLGGAVRALSDYAGRSLALCFWNRGCTWSIRALLTLNDLEAEVRGRPVAFLGVNGETKLDESAAAWRALGLRFPTIVDASAARSMAQSYRVEGYPTTVVIDPCGVVRRIRAGFSHRLASMLALELARLTSGEPCARCDEHALR